MALTVADLISNFTTPYSSDYEVSYVDSDTTPHPTNLSKMMQAFVDGYWSEIQSDIDSVRLNIHAPTMEGLNLDNWAKMLRIARASGESDASFRIRIYGAIRQLYGGTTPDSILEFVETLVGAEPGNVQIVENCENGVEPPADYCGAFYTIQFDLNLLAALGFDQSEYQAVVDEIDEVLEALSAAGVRGEVFVGGGAEWDVDDWDVDPYGA